MAPSDKNWPTLKTVLLWHQSPDGPHHDWMLQNPNRADEPDAALVTFRVTPPSSRWRELGTFELTPLPAHRAIYLTYQGEISAGRGRVDRVDEGSFKPISWTGDEYVIDVKWRIGDSGRYRLSRVDDTRWVGVWLRIADCK